METKDVYKRQVLGVGMPEGAPIPVEGTNDYRRDREGNVIVTRLNEGMCQEIAKDGKDVYKRQMYSRVKCYVSTKAYESTLI